MSNMIMVRDFQLGLFPERFVHHAAGLLAQYPRIGRMRLMSESRERRKYLFDKASDLSASFRIHHRTPVAPGLHCWFALLAEFFVLLRKFSIALRRPSTGRRGVSSCTL